MKCISKFAAVLICAALLIISSCGCNSFNSNAVIYCEVDTPPVTIDPQLAKSEFELMMVRNLFEGLMRIDENGELAYGVIEDYKYFDKVYTFHISPSAAWSDGSNVTADDFVFAFRRAVDPATKAPYAAKLSSILNADVISSGTIGPENLAVKAPDPSTLIITMAREDGDFLKNLTTSVCMPCKEEFFEDCKGQYGLTKDKILTNGSYKLSKWNREDFAVRLHRNEKYYGNFTAKNAAVFLSNNADKSNLDMLSKSSVDIAHISPNEATLANSAGLTTTQIDNIVWVMQFSGSLSYDLRKAFTLSIDRNLYSGNLGVGYNTAYSFFPSCITDQNLENVGIEGYDITTAKSLYSDAVKKLPSKKLPSTTLIYYNDPSFLTPINNIVGHWQNNLGAYINIKPASLNDTKNAISSGANYIAVYPIEIADDDAAAYINNLGYDFDGSSYSKLSYIQEVIYSDYLIIPLAFQNSVIAHSSDLNGVKTELGNGTIDFSFITKK